MNVFNLFSGQWLRDYLTYNDTKLDAGQLRSIVVQPEGPPAAFFININYPQDGGFMHSFVIERNKFGTNINDEMTYRVWMSWIASKRHHIAIIYYKYSPLPPRIHAG